MVPSSSDVVLEGSVTCIVEADGVANEDDVPSALSSSGGFICNSKAFNCLGLLLNLGE